MSDAAAAATVKPLLDLWWRMEESIRKMRAARAAELAERLLEEAQRTLTSADSLVAA